MDWLLESCVRLWFVLGFLVFFDIVIRFRLLVIRYGIVRFRRDTRYFRGLIFFRSLVYVLFVIVRVVR